MKRLAVIVVAALFAFAAPVAAQDWPTKTVRFIVPFGPGSTPDIIARMIADKLQQTQGQTVVVENKAGASGMTGTDAVAKAEPDGYTIGISIGGPLAINTLLFSKMPYDPFKDLALITMLTLQPAALAVPANLGVNNVTELVALIKKDPGKYNFGSIGSGSMSHLAMEAIAIKSGAKLVHLPFGSSPQAMTALIRNDVQMVVMPATSVLPHVQAGTVKLIAITLAEALRAAARRADPEGERHRRRRGFVERADCAGRNAAAGTRQDPPRGREAIHSADVKAKLAVQLMEPVGNTPAEFKAQVDGDLARWAPVIKEAGIKVN